MLKKYELTWDLDSIFNGGSSSEELHVYMKSLEENFTALTSLVDQFSIPQEASEVSELENVIVLLEKSSKKLQEISSFISCLTAQDVYDQQAKLLVGRRNEFAAQYASILTKLDQKFVQIIDEVWQDLLSQPTIEPFTFILNERRELAKEKLPTDQEILINDLSVDGYHAWDHMYETLVGKMSIPVTEDKETIHLSIGQAANRLNSPKREERKEAFDNLEKAWLNQSDLFSETLNHLAGFRLQTYKHRGWDSVLKEPLSYNRMSEKTLHAMWGTITNNKTPFVSYLKRKAQLLGIEELSWFDLEAPITDSSSAVSYNEAAHLIIEQFALFSPKMAAFAAKAFENNWIEAEDRSNKQPGGFCTSFPDSQQTRIFMTYSETASNAATLAHELGHAYHQEVMGNLEVLNQDYAMNVAETASTFAEMIVADAAVKNAANQQEKIALLEDKIQRSVAFFMNIHARFLFENRFYEARKKGVVSAEELDQLMVDAQKEAYCGELNGYDPTFWASKLHFHITDVPFYNFPYTFGYLFSLGIYARAMDSDNSFEASYNALLADTGRMRVEDLAKKHLDVDLEGLDFWESAIQLCINDVEEFLRLTEDKV